MSDNDEARKPVEAISVSPQDQSPDRVQSDQDQADNLKRNLDDRKQSDQDNAEAVARAIANQSITVEKINELIKSHNASAEASTKVASSSDRMALAMVEYQERSRKAAFRYRTTILLVLIGFSVLYYRQNDSNDKLLKISKENQASLDSAAASRNQLADCIKPTGKCYKDGQKRTGAAIISLERIVVVADVCAINYSTQNLTQTDRLIKVNACVDKEINK